MDFTAFEQLLQSAMGLDAASVGRATIERAVLRRMEACGLKTPDEYWDRVHDGVTAAAEVQELIENVVVPETWFFRHHQAFEALTRFLNWTWLPDNSTETRRQFRVLSVPCSTGEEPYSIVMTLLNAGLQENRMRVDAADISRKALAVARAGTYGKNSFRSEDRQFVERYFTRTASGYQLNSQVREAVTFQQGNIFLLGPPASSGGYDAIFCRNLLIYFDRAAQERILEILVGLLGPGGLLFVGPAETTLLRSAGMCPTNDSMAFAFRRAVPVATVPTPMVTRSPMAPVTTARPWEAFSSKNLRPVPQTELLLQRARANQVANASKPAVAPLGIGPGELSLALARQLADTGQIAEAIAACETVLKQDANSAPAQYLLGLLLDTLGDDRGAAAQYRKALYLDPGHGDALVHLALLLESQGETSAAFRLRERARRLDGDAG